MYLGAPCVSIGFAQYIARNTPKDTTWNIPRDIHRNTLYRTPLRSSGWHISEHGAEYTSWLVQGGGAPEKGTVEYSVPRIYYQEYTRICIYLEEYTVYSCVPQEYMQEYTEYI